MDFDFELNGLKITPKKDYILVESQKGISFWEVFTGISKLLAMPEFQEKNDIWIFRKDTLDISYSDLYKIKAFVEKKFPQGLKERKTAIVVETNVQRSLVELYAQLEEDLPHEIKVFSDITAAEDWITEHKQTD